MRESEIEEYLAQRVRAAGGEVRKVQWVGRQGAPDRLVMLPGTPGRFDWDGRLPLTIWVELKAEGLGALFPHTPHERKQHREHERLRSMGQRVVVIDSLAGVEALLA